MNRKFYNVLTVLVCIFIFGYDQIKAQDMENKLTPKQQKIVTIAANTAIGNTDALHT